MLVWLQRGCPSFSCRSLTLLNLDVQRWSTLFFTEARRLYATRAPHSLHCSSFTLNLLQLQKANSVTSVYFSLKRRLDVRRPNFSFLTTCPKASSTLDSNLLLSIWLTTFSNTLVHKTATRILRNDDRNVFRLKRDLILSGY